MKRCTLALIVLLATASASHACPYCRDATASASSAGTPTFNSSIYFMLGGLSAAGTLVFSALRGGAGRQG